MSEAAHRLVSSAEDRLVAFKEELVWQIFSKSGEFWEKVRDMRSRWGITAVSRVPPEVRKPLRYIELPKQYPRSNLVRLHEPTLYPKNPGDMEIPERNRWEFELDWLKVETVPERYSQATEWRWFMSACVLNDPPELGLISFAECGGTTPDVVGMQDGDGFEMLASPVWRLRHPFAVEGAWRWFYEAMMSEINERYLKPRGLNIHKMFSDVLRNSELYGALNERIASIPREHYIKVDEFTTYEDVEAGFKMVVAEQGRKKGGGHRRRPLAAVECALLYDNYNAVNPTDKRRRKWTYQRLAEQYDLKGARAAKDYVAYGRELLKKLGDETAPALFRVFLPITTRVTLVSDEQRNPDLTGCQDARGFFPVSAYAGVAGSGTSSP